MSFGNLLGGALQGIGSGIALNAQTKAAAAAADVADRREQALVSLRGDVAKQANAQQGELARVSQEAKYDLIDRNDARTAGRDTSKALVVGRAQSDSQVRLERAKFTNDQALERLKSGLRMSEAQREASLKLFSETTLAGQEVGETRVATDGSMVLYSKTGKVLRRSGAGMFTPDGTKSENASQSALERARGTSAGRTSIIAPQGGPQRASGGKSYTLGEAKVTAAARGIPVAEVQRVMQANGYH